MANEKLIARIGADIKGFQTGMSKSVDIAKRSAKRIALAFAGITIASALVGQKFEKELMETATVAQAFGKDLEALENKARELGRTTAFTATQAAEGMYDLACLPGSEYILGGDFRVHEIRNYNNGSIIGNKGVPQKIKEFTSRKCSEGNIYNIKPRGLRPFKVTGNHPIYVIKSKWCKPSKENVVLCKPDCNQDCSKKYYEKYKPEWVPAENLNVGDILLQPIIKEERDIEINWEIKKKLKKYDLLPKTVDKNFSRFLGLIIGDGWADNKNERVFCAFSDDNPFIKKWYINYIKSIGYSCQEKQMIECTQVIFWSKPIATLISDWIGKGAGNKRIPPELFYANKEIILSFLKGYIESDGCLFYENNRPVISITTISPHIAYFMNLLSSKVRGVFSILFDDKKKANRQIVKMPSGYICSLQDSYSLRTTDANFISKLFKVKKDCKELRYKKIWMDDNYVYYPIYKIDVEVFYGNVYNFETEDNTYSTGVIVHNSAGMKTREIIDAVEHAMKLAGATGNELSQATHVLAATLKQFSLDASDSKRVADTFAGAITNSLLTLEKLTEGMKYAGTTGAALGWSLEQTVASLAMFADLGLEGTMSGTNLRMAMISLAKGTKLSRDALKEMGLTLEDVNPEGMSFGEVLKAIGEQAVGTKGAVDIFGARAGLNVKQLAKLAREGKLDFKGFVDMLVESQKGVGRATEMYGRMMDIFWGQWKIVWSAIQELGIEIFDLYKEEAKDVFKNMTESLNAFTKTVHENKAIIVSAFYNIAIGIAEGVKLAIQSISLLLKAWENLQISASYIFKGIGWIHRRYVQEQIKGTNESITALSELIAEGNNEYIPVLQKEIEKLQSLQKEYKDLTVYLEDHPSTLKNIENSYLGVQSTIDKTTASLAKFKGMLEGKKKARVSAILTAVAPVDEGFDDGVPTVKDSKKPTSIPTRPTSASLKMETENRLNAYETILQHRKELSDGIINLINEEMEKERAKREATKELDMRISQIGMTAYERDIDNINREKDAFILATGDKIKATKLAESEITKIKKQQTQARLSLMASELGKVADTARIVSDLTKGQSKEAWATYKAFAIAEAVITGAKAVLSAWESGSKYGSVAKGYVYAGIAAAFAAAQIAAIESAEPPSYDEGGVSTEPGVYYSGVPEAHIPLKSGKVPVEMKESGKGNIVVIKLENPRFQNAAEQRRTFRIIAAEVTRRLAPSVIYDNYKNDGRMRKMIRDNQ